MKADNALERTVAGGSTRSLGLMGPRVIAGFVIAPLLLPVVMFAMSAVNGVQGGIALAMFLSFFTYAVTIVLGAPLVIWFRRRRWSELWRYAIGGAALGVVPLIVIGRWGEIPLLAGPVFSVIGAGSAAVFWLIAVRGNKAFQGA